MDGEELRKLQAPLKARYREDPKAALVTLSAEGRLEQETVTCAVTTKAGLAEAGLHPAVGGDGSWSCSGDMLLESLAACAGVTLMAVATALGLSVRGTVRTEGDLDFRGTLGAAKDVPVGFTDIRLKFDLEADATQEQLENLLKLTERYCVIYQTLRGAPKIATSYKAARKVA